MARLVKGRKNFRAHFGFKGSRHVADCGSSSMLVINDASIVDCPKCLARMSKRMAPKKRVKS